MGMEISVAVKVADDSESDEELLASSCPDSWLYIPADLASYTHTVHRYQRDGRRGRPRQTRGHQYGLRRK